jgi:hypothetical protein
MVMTRMRRLPVLLAAAVALIGAHAAPECRAGEAAPLSAARIYFEYNAIPNDLGVHVFLDGEDRKQLKIVNPQGRKIFKVAGKAAYKTLGMTELFFEGAEPPLAEFPLDDLLALFPKGEYEFSGKTADGNDLVGTATLSHAIPAGPSNVSAEVGPGDSLVISWDAVTGPPAGFPVEPIDIVGCEVIVSAFQVTVPDTTTSVTVSPEFVASLASGEQLFEVLAIDVSGNQTITEGAFMKP